MVYCLPTKIFRQTMHRIGTHSGSFHADDALGVAILKQLFPDAEVVRTRDPAIWCTCDALVDVGGVDDPSQNRFDHHQKGFNARRHNGIPYAGSGLVWRKFGAAYVQSVTGGLVTDPDAVAAEVDARLIQHADAVDSGISVKGPADFGLSGIIGSLNATWLDEAAKDDTRFVEAFAVAGLVLRNLVANIVAEHSAAEKVRVATRLSEGRVLVLDTARLPYDATVCAEMPDVLFVVYPEFNGGQYQVRVVPKQLGSFVARADLPQSWAGLRDADLASMTGVDDAVFCHNGRFICGAKSKEGALRMAQLAVSAAR